MLELVLTILKMLFVITIPGYFLCLAAFPKKADVSLFERIVFSIFFSLTLTALLLIVLYSLFEIIVDFLTVLSTAFLIIVFSLSAYLVRSRKVKKQELFPIIPKFYVKRN